MTLLAKQCVICSKVKPLSEFSKQKDTKDKLKYYCKSCNSVKMKAWHAKNPSHNLLTRYGITIEQKIEMVKKQNNCCAICNSVFKNSIDTHVDHCHNSQDIRGILCGPCNRAIGLLKDSPLILRNAAKYLEKYAKPNSTPPVPKRTNLKGIDNSQSRSVFAPGIGENDNYLDNHIGTISREDLNYSPQASSGNSMGQRSEEVGTSLTLESLQNYGLSGTAARWTQR